MKLTSTADLNNMDQDEFDKLTPEQIRQMQPAAQEGEEQSDDNNPDDSAEDGEEAGTADDSQSEDEAEEESDSDEQAEEEEEDDDTQQSEGEGDDVTGTSVDNVPDQKQSPKQDKTAKPDAEENAVDHKAFYERITGNIKAAGTEISVSNPEDIISLMQKGLDYTKKMQAVSHLRGLNEVLTENDLTDPATLGYLIDLKNHKPEAIARLLKESGLDAFDLDEDKAAAYQATQINIAEKTKVVNVREIVEAHANDEQFNEVFATARTWDDASQQEIVTNPQLLVTLTEHKRNGVYDRIVAEMQQERLIRGNVSEPELQQYVRIGNALFGGNQNGGSAQVPNNGLNQQTVPTNKQRVVVKSNKNIAEQRKRVAAPANAAKSKSSVNVKSALDIFNMPEAEFNKLSPEILRKLK